MVELVMVELKIQVEVIMVEMVNGHGHVGHG